MRPSNCSLKGAISEPLQIIRPEIQPEWLIDGTVLPSYQPYPTVSAATTSARSSMNFIQDSAQPDIQEGLALHLQGELNAAAQAYERILAGDPDSLPALLHLGAVRISQSRSHDALGIFQHAVAIAPESAEAHANLATAL